MVEGVLIFRVEYIIVIIVSIKRITHTIVIVVKLFGAFFNIKCAIIVIISICDIFYSIVIMVKSQFQKFSGIEFAIIVIVFVLSIG